MQEDLKIKGLIEEYYIQNKLVGFVDDVGRGSIAGPLYTCCVVLGNSKFSCSEIDDSKKLSKEKIRTFSDLIKNNVNWSLGIVSISEINKINNMLEADLFAMKRSVEANSLRPDVLFVDGPWRINIDIEQHSIVKGDSRVFGIACASIIAKQMRDDYMIDLHKMFPNYHWDQNVGYHTKVHIEAIKKYGITEHHRIHYKDVKGALDEYQN